MAKLLGFSTVDKVKAPYTLVGKHAVVQDLLNEFYCRKGERVMRPNYGSIIWDLVMDPASDETEQLVREDISRILAKDPRVKELEVQVIMYEHGIRADVKISIQAFGNAIETLYLDYVNDITEGVI
jgi:phage baseplate assembly protein W